MIAFLSRSGAGELALALARRPVGVSAVAGGYEEALQTYSVLGAGA